MAPPHVEMAQAPVYQSESIKGELSVQAAVRAALQNHPSVRGAQQRLSASGFDLDAAEYQRFPTPAVDLGKINGGGSGGGNQTSVSLTQPLYTFGRITAGIEAAESRVAASTVAVDEARFTLTEQTILAFFEVIKAEARLKVQAEFVKNHTNLRDTVSRRFEGDVGSQSDLLLAQTRLDQAENDLAVIRAQLEKAQITLTSLTQVKADSYSTPATLGPPLGSEAQLQSMAQAYSPLLKRLAAERDALNKEADSARAVTKPQLVLRAERVESNVPTSYSDNRLITALQYQPGAGLSAGSAAAAAQARALAAELDIQSATLELQNRCTAAYSDMMIALSQEKALSKVMVSNQSLFESMLRQFQSGKRTWLDVLNSLRETNQAALAHANASSDAQANIRRVALLAGLPNE